MCVSLFGETALRCNLRDVRHPTRLEFRVQGSYGTAMVSPTNSNNNINIIHRANMTTVAVSRYPSSWVGKLEKP